MFSSKEKDALAYQQIVNVHILLTVNVQRSYWVHPARIYGKSHTSVVFLLFLCESGHKTYAGDISSPSPYVLRPII